MYVVGQRRFLIVLLGRQQNFFRLKQNVKRQNYNNSPDYLLVVVARELLV